MSKNSYNTGWEYIRRGMSKIIWKTIRARKDIYMSCVVLVHRRLTKDNAITCIYSNICVCVYIKLDDNILSSQ